VVACQLAELREANEALTAKLARLEHLLSRNSGTPSRDDDPVSHRPRRSRVGVGRCGRGASSPARPAPAWPSPTLRTGGVTCFRGAAAVNIHHI
jgi:hypothetical protein